MSHRVLATTLTTWICVAAFAGLAMAQDEVNRFQRTLEQIERQTRIEPMRNVPLNQRVFFDVGGVLSYSFINLDDDQDNNHTLHQYDLIGWAQLNIDGVHDFFLRGRSTYRDWGRASDALDPAGDDWIEARLDRGIYRFDLGRAIEISEGKAPDVGFVFQGGRQLVHWANGLVLSQELDSVLLTATMGDLEVTGLAGFATRGTFDIDAGRPGYDGDTRRGFFGGIVSYQLTPRHRPFFYGLVQRDYNDNDTRTDGAITTKFHYDSYYIGGGMVGNLSDNLVYAVEVAYQGGETLSTSIDPDNNPVDQTFDDIEAWALNAQLMYLFADENDSRLSLELIVASGDDDRQIGSSTLGGNAPNTNDCAFQGFGLVNTGLAFAPEASNLIIVRGGASTFPLPGSELFGRLLVGVDLFVFHKYDDDAPISEASEDHGYLGFETDIYTQWQVTSDLGLAVRYGAFFPGEGVIDDSVRHFIFTTVSLSF